MNEAEEHPPSKNPLDIRARDFPPNGSLAKRPKSRWSEMGSLWGFCPIGSPVSGRCFPFLTNLQQKS